MSEYGNGWHGEKIESLSNLLFPVIIRRNPCSSSISQSFFSFFFYYFLGGVVLEVLEGNFFSCDPTVREVALAYCVASMGY